MTFSTADERDTDRVLRSFANIRDLGGLPLVSGGTTSPGVLIRSDAPYADDDDPVGVPWPPSTVVDLRDPSERGALRLTWPAEVRLVNRQVSSGARIDRLADTALSDIYTAMLQTGGDRLTAALNAFDAAGSTLVHCAAGKDRTGVIVAIAALLAGVDEAAVVADYRRTEENIAGVLARLKQRDRVPKGISLDAPILRTPREAIDLVIDALTGHRGGPWGWFEAHGGDVEYFEGWVARFAPRAG
ncbi:protein-tyrosine-phosphatase [Gordonia alkanivorans]|uniref:tyrosine-protein phosphatase n=1 Tax=Gordonia alkanivorans TaxID=84096 RepID=UPI000FDF2CAA|nr:tyrosine-protein phosphatase [Gordonia alkanivorans]AZZ80863.1 protein-tyrosine-phosphatase [Gordonia alkanivorans]